MLLHQFGKRLIFSQHFIMLVRDSWFPNPAKSRLWSTTFTTWTGWFQSDHCGKEKKMATDQKPNNDHFTVLDVEGWNNRWDKRQIGFHRDVIHIMLEKHVDKMVNGRENLKIFLPLCGKSLDMKWLADKGHSVVGVECSVMAIEEFFEEQNLSFTIEPVDEVKGTLYKCNEIEVRIYCCDFYLFNKEVAGQFDAIWDRGSMVAINRNDRQIYADILKTLMKPGCRTLLDTFDYDESLYSGPPHYVPADQIQSLFGDTCSLEQLDYFDAFEEKHEKWGLKAFHEKVHLLITK